MSIDWIKADWPAPANIHAGTTLRRGGVSEDSWASLNLGDHVNDNATAVAENRQRFRVETNTFRGCIKRLGREVGLRLQRLAVGFEPFTGN